MNRLEFLKRLAGSIAGLVVGTKLARAAAPIELPKIVADPEMSGIQQILLLEQEGILTTKYPEWESTFSATRPLSAADIRALKERFLEDDRCRNDCIIHVPRGTRL